MAFLGTYLLHLLGASGDAAQTHVELVLGVALLVGAGAMVLRPLGAHGTGDDRDAAAQVRGLVALLPVALGALRDHLRATGPDLRRCER